jgi:hypothetical protein
MRTPVVGAPSKPSSSLGNKNLTGQDLARAIVAARHRIKSLTSTTRGHLIATIGRDGRVRIKTRDKTGRRGRRPPP